jgi:hypothetical protein
MNKTMFKLLASAALLVGAPAAFAQSLIVPAQSGVVNGAGQTFVVNFTSNNTAGLDFTLDAAPANITLTAVTSAVTGVTCALPPAFPQRVICNGFAASGFLPNGAITLTYTANATPGAVNLTLSAVVFSDAMTMPQMGTVTSGVLTLNTGPSGPSLTYNPAGATAITVAASGSGTAVTSNIAVTSTGGDLLPTVQTTTLACTVTGAGFATPVVTGSPFSASATPTTGNVGLACAGTATTGTLSCTQTRGGTGGGAPIVTTWPLTCASAPGFVSTPADGGTLNIVGVQSSTATGAVSVSNPGTAALTISGCAVTGASFTLGTPSATVAAGGTGTIPVTCAVPAAAGANVTGTLQCNTNAAAPADVINYNLSCTAQSASIPTLGFGGKALMALLMLGFGLVGFQLYRRSA